MANTVKVDCSMMDFIQDKILEYSDKNGKYPNKIIIGYNVYLKLKEEVREHLGIDTSMRITEMYGIPVLHTNDFPDLIEVGHVDSVKVDNT